MLPAPVDGDDDQIGRSSYLPPSNVSLVTDTAYRREVVSKIIIVHSKDTYAIVSDFEWYISMLSDLVYVAGLGLKSVGEPIIRCGGASEEGERTHC